ncbi:hypothetical protein GX48_05123 [Paracoccidioides brasiliensis]|nr:hypothetical protein GX48_05123 [Paracoccidioides brasiliensis]
MAHTSVSDGGSDRPGTETAPTTTRERATPQNIVDTFWGSFNSKFPGRVLKVLPRRPGKAPPQPISNIAHGESALDSYNRARKECEHAVNRIAKQCLRINQKYVDPHFDIEADLKSGQRNCLDGLGGENVSMKPKGVKRVSDIFEKPQFYVNNATAGDVRQGNDGDCWLMAALCTLGNMEGLINRVCVARNEQVGVYGFVFYRGKPHLLIFSAKHTIWRHTIIDDKLYLRAPDYEDAAWEREVWDDIGRSDTELNYRKTWQTGSRALYFAQCSDDNETWLPLLEKAYAKAHGDYSSIEGGFVGEAIEDLTGGVTSEIISRDVLDQDRFWNEDLMNVNKKFVFGCATGLYGRWLYPSYYDSKERSGIHECHAYSVMDAKEINGQRLLRLRNPWGHKEWSGPWSDGSEQWTPEWMNLLQHKFGNDGVFWISYEDFLHKYEFLDRTRLFGDDWIVTQKWTNFQVPWTLEYHKTKFVIEITRKGPVVIVLSQLDYRYFKGLDGQYKFELQFRLEKDGQDDYIVRNQNSIYMSRSVSADITLEPGTYTVLVRVRATKSKTAPPEEVIKEKATTEREKLVQIGQSYDLAHAKGVDLESGEEEAERKNKELEKRAALRKKERDLAEVRSRRKWVTRKKIAARDKRRKKKAEQVRERRAARQQTKNAENQEGQQTEEKKQGGEADEEREDGHSKKEIQQNSSPEVKEENVELRAEDAQKQEREKHGDQEKKDDDAKSQDLDPEEQEGQNDKGADKKGAVQLRNEFVENKETKKDRDTEKGSEDVSHQGEDLNGNEVKEQGIEREYMDIKFEAGDSEEKEVNGNGGGKKNGEIVEPQMSDLEGNEIKKGGDMETMGEVSEHQSENLRNKKELQEDEGLGNKSLESFRPLTVTEDESGKENNNEEAKDIPPTPEVAKEQEPQTQKENETDDKNQTTEPTAKIAKRVEEDSGVDSGSDFEFDSEIDMSPIEDSDSEGDEEEEGDIDGEYSVQPPWNAVCVIGLRVYSKDSGLTVRVVKPKLWQTVSEPQRDCDDPAVE